MPTPATCWAIFWVTAKRSAFWATAKRSTLFLGAAAVLLPLSSAQAAGQHIEKHFTVSTHPVLTIQNATNGRIEVKSWKNPEVVIAGNRASAKVAVEMEQAANRIGLSTTILDKSAKPAEVETTFDITVPEESELQIHTTSMGTIYVEQVYGDMTLESVAGDVHLKEVSGYIIVKTVSGSLQCMQCAGKLNFASISGSAQFLQPQLNNLNVSTTSGNILYDGDFLRDGIYTMKSGMGLVEVRFSGSDSFDLKAQTTSGTVDNQAQDFLKPDSHGLKHLSSKFAKSLAGSVNAGLAQVNLSSFSGTIRIRKRD
ncbi:MAG: DUF4097 domain-containing protein [Acidobacteriia bacterium]|nr:DUF4097 domain-containing protein [Terriglobia bacterium]